MVVTFGCFESWLILTINDILLIIKLNVTTIVTLSATVSSVLRGLKGCYVSMRGRCFSLLIASATCACLLFLIYSRDDDTYVRTKIQSHYKQNAEKSVDNSKPKEQNYQAQVKINYDDEEPSPTTEQPEPQRETTDKPPSHHKAIESVNNNRSDIKTSVNESETGDPFYRPKFPENVVQGVTGLEEIPGLKPSKNASSSKTVHNATESIKTVWKPVSQDDAKKAGYILPDVPSVVLPTMKANYEFSDKEPRVSTKEEREEMKLLADWKRQQQQEIAEERRKIEEEQHKLLEEKIKFQKEVGEVLQEIRHGEVRGNMVNFIGIPRVAGNISKVPPVDSAQWMGLNHTVVHTKFPEIVLNPQYRIQSFFAPDDPMASGMQGHPRSLNDLTEGQAEDRFYQLISQTHMNCGNIQRLGNLGDGGWDICMAEPYSLQSGCIVYSFGINFDFSFDDSIATKHHCEVRAFDPSMNTGDHAHSYLVYFYQLGLGAANTVSEEGWRLETLSSIKKKLNHLETPIDVIKIDIEHNEWDCFQTMLEEGALRNVKQLIFEMHTPEVYTVRRPSNKEDFVRMSSLLRGLEEQGFRRYHFHFNAFGMYTSVRTGKSRTCCYELYYLNIHFLK